MLKRIGIMGGTFSPIHFGHLKLATTAYEEFNLDKVLFIPSGNSYLKNDVLESRYRLEMTKLAVMDTPYFEVSTVEIERCGNSYTYETLRELKDIYPESELFFIVGADSFFYMDKWKEPGEIFKYSTILVSVRDNSSYEELGEKRSFFIKEYDADIRFLSMDFIDISSTVIRERIKDGKPVNNMVPEKVLDYIYINKLYF